MSRIKALRDKKAALLQEAGQLVTKMDAGTITPDEVARLNAITSGKAQTETDPAVASLLKQVNDEISQEEVLMAERRSMTPVQDPNADTATEAAARVPAEARVEPVKFRSLGEQMMAIAAAGTPNSSRDSRLIMAAGPTGMSEGVGSDGGFLVQSDFVDGLLQNLYAGGDILNLINPYKIGVGPQSNGIRMNGVDETSRANGSRAGGIQAFWSGEAQQYSGTTPKFRKIGMELDKLTGLLYATDELLQDTTALESWINRAFTDEFTFKVEDAVINGTGAGMPLGILNSGAVITVPKETNQPNASINTFNILNMWARLPAKSRKTAVWLNNVDTEPALGQMYTPGKNVAGTENVGVIPAVGVNYTAPGVNGNQYATLQGRPVIPVEYCATLGTPGDLILWDPSQYLAIDKGQTQTASSIHVRFLFDETVFRFVYRFNGQPTWRQPVTPFKGSNSQSPFIVLAQR